MEVNATLVRQLHLDILITNHKPQPQQHQTITFHKPAPHPGQQCNNNKTMTTTTTMELLVNHQMSKLH